MTSARDLGMSGGGRIRATSLHVMFSLIHSLNSRAVVWSNAWKHLCKHCDTVVHIACVYPLGSIVTLLPQLVYSPFLPLLKEFYSITKCMLDCDSCHVKWFMLCCEPLIKMITLQNLWDVIIWNRCMTVWAKAWPETNVSNVHSVSKYWVQFSL